MIKVHAFKKAFHLGLRRKRVDAVKNISFEVEPKEIFGFLGPNGAGKTTTIKALLGLIRPDGGNLELCGSKIDDLARSLAERPSPSGTPDRSRPASADPALDRIARVLAAPVSRRRAIRLGAAAAGASFFTFMPSRAHAQAADDPCPACADRPGTSPLMILVNMVGTGRIVRGPGVATGRHFY